MVELNNNFNLIIWGAIVMIIGLALIQPIADDISTLEVSSISIGNESVTLTTSTLAIANETHTLVANATTLNNNFLTELTALRNISSGNIMLYCNITLRTGALKCNETYSSTIYADYTYNNYRTGTLAYNELIAVDNCTNSTMIEITRDLHCNTTLSTGNLVVNYDNFTSGAAYLTYRYEPDTYVHSGAARTLTSMTTMFFAIGIMAIGLVMVFKGFKDIF